MLLRNFIIACWVVFAAYWIAAAASRKRTAERQSWASRSWYLLLIVSAFALPLGAFVLDPLARRVVPPGPALDIVAAVLCAAGLVLAIGGRRANRSSWSAILTLKRGHVLVTGGPYPYVRHPIYSAILVMFFATGTRGRPARWLRGLRELLDQAATGRGVADAALSERLCGVPHQGESPGSVRDLVPPLTKTPFDLQVRQEITEMPESDRGRKQKPRRG